MFCVTLQLMIGCTGWSYAGWSGTFYPKKMKSADWLRYYSQIFDITEINSTFYKIPDQSTTKKWNDETPENFRFTAKFPSVITHEKRLENVSSEIFTFLSSLTPIHQKISALVLQLPPSLSFDEAKPRLSDLLSNLPPDFLYPIEGRHQSWFSDDAIDYLKENKLCLVWNDVSGVNNPLPVAADYLYVRLIGDRSISASDFGKITKNRAQSIKNWAHKMKSQNVSLAMIMANNHYEGFSSATANSLRMELGLPELVWEEKKQAKLD